MNSIKIVSYNIHKGFSFGNTKFVLNKIKTEINKLNPDIVLLQEIVGDHISKRKNINNWQTNAQYEFMAHEIWKHYAYGKNAVYNKGNHGNAILSKYPILEWDNIDISTNRLEQRGILHAIIELPNNKKVHALCSHLNLLESGRVRQIKEISKRIKNHIKDKESLFLAGDFNDWQQNITNILENEIGLKEAFYNKNKSHAKSFPSFLPTLKLDRFYYRGLEIEDAKCLKGKPWNALSDHLPLLIKVNL